MKPETNLYNATGSSVKRTDRHPMATKGQWKLPAPVYLDKARVSVDNLRMEADATMERILIR